MTIKFCQKCKHVRSRPVYFKSVDWYCGLYIYGDYIGTTKKEYIDSTESVFTMSKNFEIPEACPYRLEHVVDAV